MSARDDILKKLNKKTQEYGVYRRASTGKIKPEQLVKEFIDSVELARTEGSGLNFVQVVERAEATLEQRIRRIDPRASVEVLWDREEQTEIWSDLRPTGVRIIWSDQWRSKNPTEEVEMYVSVEQIFLEGL